MMSPLVRVGGYQLQSAGITSGQHHDAPSSKQGDHEERQKGFFS